MTVGLAAMCYLLRLAIDSLFTDWDPVRHYRKCLTNVIQDKMQLNTVLITNKANVKKKDQLQKAQQHAGG